MSLVDKIQRGLATLSDQDEALKGCVSACEFARFVHGADIEKCREVACKHPGEAYYFALNVKGADIEKCQNAACKNPVYAYEFAKSVEGANLSKIKELCPDIADKIDDYVMNKVLQ